MIYKAHSPLETPSWSVCATVLEPTPLVVSFVAYYLALGAEEVFIFLDAPQPETQRILSDIPRVRVRLCDQFYWNEVRNKTRPSSVVKRQLQNVYQAYLDTDAKWMCHVDVDEFIRADLSISKMLQSIPADVECLRIPNLERVFHAETPQVSLFDGAFRKPLPKECSDTKALLDRDGPISFMIPDGVTGHAEGKSFMRTGLDLIPGIHSPRALPRYVHGKLKSWTAQNAWVLHFDGLTKLHWCSKYLLQIAKRDTISDKMIGPKRARQLNYVQTHDDTSHAISNMHDDLKTLPMDTANWLGDLGLLFEFDIADVVADAVRDLALADPLDLSPETFDLEIADRYSVAAEDIEALRGENRAAAVKVVTKTKATAAKKTSVKKAVSKKKPAPRKTKKTTSA